MSVAPGWYPDQTGQVRWWDGFRWTEHVQQPVQQPAPGGYGQARVSSSGPFLEAPSTSRLPSTVFAAARTYAAPLTLIVLVALAGSVAASMVSGLLLVVPGLFMFRSGTLLDLSPAALNFLVFLAASVVALSLLPVSALRSGMISAVLSGRSQPDVGSAFRYARGAFRRLASSLLLPYAMNLVSFMLVWMIFIRRFVGGLILSFTILGVPSEEELEGLPLTLLGLAFDIFDGLSAAGWLGLILAAALLPLSQTLVKVAPAYAALSDSPGSNGRLIRHTSLGFRFLPLMLLTSFVLASASQLVGLFVGWIPFVGAMFSFALSLVVSLLLSVTGYMLALRVPR